MNSLSKLIPTPIRKLFWFVSGSSCGLSFMVLFLLATGSAFAQPKADLARYEKDVLPLLDKYCMDCHDSDTKKGRFDLESLAPVGSLQPNPWGLHDVLGNVAEWTDDAVMRGGSWVSIPQYCRSAHRQKMGDRDQRNYLGVRVVIRKASTATPKKK